MHDAFPGSHFSMRSSRLTTAPKFSAKSFRIASVIDILSGEGRGLVFASGPGAVSYWTVTNRFIMQSEPILLDHSSTLCL